MDTSLLPGADVIDRGLADLAGGSVTAEALLVSIGAPRLRALGWDVSVTLANAEERLYQLLAETDADAAHSRYNALIRHLVSFQRAAACAK